ncbi:hypothetical protein [Roseomonas sp. HF4]|uniref:hypothetical protein n=1 Tax=Roseomonas sp. HF4 TaxID=2562313 RepID=UPI0010BF6C8C|nr:hypothetical protein [Roseomonas sp. HF4]
MARAGCVQRRVSRGRRAAFAATAVLAGCSTVARDAAVVRGFQLSEVAGQTGIVLLRVVGADGTGAGAISPRAELWNMDTGQRLAGPGRYRPPGAPAEAGWRHEGPLPAGRYFLRLATPDPRDATPADLTFTVPAPSPPVLYVGTFRFACEANAACRFDRAPLDQSDEARALVAADVAAAGPPTTRLARPYPAALAASGLPRPVTPEIRVDSRLWLAAIDWNAVTSQGALPAPPDQVPAEPRSDLEPWSGEESLVSTSNMGGQIGGAIGGGLGAAAGAGSIFALGAMVAILVVVVPTVLIARAIAEDQRNRRTAEEARRTAEALRAAALAQEQWGPCAAGIAATLAPDNVERHLRVTLSPQRQAGRGAALPGPWEATVSRVIFRQCGAAPDRHGVEVATRWTARRAGEADPAFDIAFARSVAEADPDPRLVHSRPPPWELPVASAAACRPLAAYCGAGGSALLLEEVLRGVTEARDAIATTR